MQGADIGGSLYPSRRCGPGDLQAVWREFNEQYFAGRLSPIPIAWSTRLTSSAGMFVSRVGPRHSDRSRERRVIKLSIPLLRGEGAGETIGTLAHEMIHQWQYDVLKRRPNHGHAFSHKMAEMNRAGLGVTIRHQLADSVEAFIRYAWRCAQCGQVYERQRRTIRPRRHRCGSCAGPLREVAMRQVKRLKVKGKGRELQKSVQMELDLAIP